MMHRAYATLVKKIVLSPQGMAMHDVAKQLAPTSHKISAVNAKHFAPWIIDTNLSFSLFDRDELGNYLTHITRSPHHINRLSDVSFWMKRSNMVRLQRILLRVAKFKTFR